MRNGSERSMAESWVARHGTTLIAVGAALVLGIVALVLWMPGWWSSRAPAPVGEPSNPGWKIRYDATISLARRGSPNTRLDILEEMLDESTQRANFRTKQADGQEVIDEQGMYRMLAATLDATELFHDKRKDSNADVRVHGAGLVGRTLITSTFVHIAYWRPDDRSLILLWLRPAVEKLTESPNRAVREKAKDLLEKLS